MSASDVRNLTVEAARARMLDGLPAPGCERGALDAWAVGRVLAEPIVASRDQPPYDASAMDGWAVGRLEGGNFHIAGESAAGRPFAARLRPQQAVRIFTGAAVPAGAVRVVPQEVARCEGEQVVIAAAGEDPRYIRPAGGDFRAGQVLLPAGRRIDAWTLALAAAAGRSAARLATRPRVAILSTGDEIVRAGEAAGPHQVFDSAGPALAALARLWGGEVQMAPPIGDTEAAIVRTLQPVEADLLVTVGGASVGDHDLVKPALAQLGLVLAVETVRLRPGRPTWFGRLADGRRVLGLPGNPASALVCAELFLKPLLLAWQGADPQPPTVWAQLAADLPAEGPREHWLRARLESLPDGRLCASAFPDQDSSLVSVFAEADALIRRPAGAPVARAGEPIQALPLARRF